MPSEYTNLVVWRRAECSWCDLQHLCPKKPGNLRMCLEEDKREFDVESPEYLIRRVIRFVCARRIKSRLFDNLRSAAQTWSTGGKEGSYAAVLYCADQDEFTKCRHST